MRHTRRGFTLVEVLVVMLLVSIIFGALVVALIVGRTSLLSTDAYVLVQEEARRALDTLTKELHEAGNVDTELTAAGQDASNATRLNIQLARGYNVAGCTPNAICWGNDASNGGWVHYLVNNSTLYRCQSGASDTAITDFSGCRTIINDVQTFLVDYSSANRMVTMRLATRHNSPQLPGGQLTMTPAPLRTQIRLRNP